MNDRHRLARLVSLIFSALLVSPLVADQRIVFTRDDAVYIANLDGLNETKIADGTFPALSPDGAKVAFTSVEKNGDTYIRRIAVFDVGTRDLKRFDQVPSTNSYYPRWSPDGKRILFTLQRDEQWGIATVAADGTDFKPIRNGEPEEVPLYSPCWASDGQTIFAQDMTNIYRIALSGEDVGKWSIAKVIANGDMSGDSRIAAAQDGHRLLLSVEMGEEVHRKDWDGPLPALWTFDLLTQKATRITPRSLLAWDGCWIDNDNVLFLSQAAGEQKSSVYRAPTNGKNPKRLVKDAELPDTNSR
jgi:TolB protein